MKESGKISEILLVEDNDNDAEIAMSVLGSKTNAAVHRVYNGQEALDYLSQKGRYADNDKNNIPKVVLLDINLPKLNGIEVLRRMRSQPHTERIPVFVFT